MKIEILVKPAEDEESLGIGNYDFKHIGCGPMRVHRNPATSQYTLRCTCDIEIFFDQGGVADNTITKTVIDQQARSLPDKSFISGQVTEVRVVSESAA